MGITIIGLFLEKNKFRNVDEDTGAVSFRHSVSVACGSTAYRIFMRDDFDDSVLDDLAPGTVVRVKARPYVNKNGRLSWSDGEDFKVAVN